ncbi:AraC family transcriptional regulator [Metabacillus niabensis]|uniref:AraC-like DNA-binding protein n=1 Tax=Metabacillus niabensis TaxID=324854 RepID=A0ABT9Z0M6_9BACI|nr:AraC family transcriptional regulator [Metabacillus niabensis]MDQ0225809.1 AraC-like DNA-binding protein [Metabacillus niabensis]
MRYIFNNHRENDSIYLYSGGYDPCEKGHTYGPTVRSGYMLHYVRTGKGIFTSEGKKYHLKEGDFFFIEPNKVIKYEADNQMPWSTYWIGFRGSLIKDYIRRTSISRFNPIFNIEKAGQIKDKLSEIIEISMIKEDNDLLLNAKLLEILYLLTNLFPNIKEKNAERNGNMLFVLALQFIRNNFETDIQISEIANSLAIDRTYLHRLFKKELGVSPKEYLTECRIRKAKDLLKTTDLPISTVAKSSGYEDTQQFSKVFKHQTTYTPTQYRNQTI